MSNFFVFDAVPIYYTGRFDSKKIMAKNNLAVGLDIGSAYIKVAVGTKREAVGSFNVLGASIIPSVGLRRGTVIEPDETARVIIRAIEEAERMAGEPIETATISIGGSGISSLNSKGVVAISRADGEVGPDDIERVIEAAAAIAVPGNQEILQVIPRSFTIDDQANIRDPLGMRGIRLEVDAHIITAQSNALKNLDKAIDQASIDIERRVPVMLASAEAVLEKNQREAGVLLVDIGGTSTSLAVFEEGSLLHTAVLPIGSSHITNDIAIGLRSSLETAERVKLEYGSAMSRQVGLRETIDLGTFSAQDKHQVSRHQIARIIEARLGEMMHMIREELRVIGHDSMLPAGAVFTGGGSKLSGLLDMAKEKLALPVTLGFPRELNGVMDKVDDPAFAAVVGLMLYSDESQKGRFLFRSLSLSGVGGSIRDWFRSFLPK